jgi:hypothetical protein
VLKDAIQQTARQAQAMEEIIAALIREDEDGVRLKHAARRFCLAPICHTIGSEVTCLEFLRYA